MGARVESGGPAEPCDAMIVRQLKQVVYCGYDVLFVHYIRDKELEHLAVDLLPRGERRVNRVGRTAGALRRSEYSGRGSNCCSTVIMSCLYFIYGTGN